MSDVVEELHPIEYTVMLGGAHAQQFYTWNGNSMFIVKDYYGNEDCWTCYGIDTWDAAMKEISKHHQLEEY
jgi:hypothetical protein